MANILIKINALVFYSAYNAIHVCYIGLKPVPESVINKRENI